MSTLSASERLFRNIHPNDFDNGRIFSSTFDPSIDHAYLLSLDKSSLTTAEQCFVRHTSRGLTSIAVCGVDVSDFSLESIVCANDPLPDNPAHVVADFSPFGTSARKKKARRLAERAMHYGLDFKP